MIREIVTDPEQLHIPSEEVNTDDYKEMKEAKNIIADLKETMATSKSGVGMAASQIGIKKRILICSRNNGKVFAIINPNILAYSEQETSIPEGCLSCPGQEVNDIMRSVQIKIHGYDIKGMPIREMLSGAESVIFQHEYDHLNGRIITDYVIEEEVVEEELPEIS
jgi:peptide deformylase